MLTGNRETPTIRKVKVNVSDTTWQRVKMMAAYMVIYTQDLVGHLIQRQVDDLWEEYGDDLDARDEAWHELMLEIRPDRAPIHREVD